MNTELIGQAVEAARTVGLKALFRAVESVIPLDDENAMVARLVAVIATAKEIDQGMTGALRKLLAEFFPDKAEENEALVEGLVNLGRGEAACAPSSHSLSRSHSRHRPARRRPPASS